MTFAPNEYSSEPREAREGGRIAVDDRPILHRRGHRQIAHEVGSDAGVGVGMPWP